MPGQVGPNTNSSGGGNGVLHQSDPVTLTASQLKGLGAAGVDVVPAGGANILLVPVSATLLYRYGTVQYGNLAATNAAHDLALTVNGIAVTHWMSSKLAIQPASDRATFMYPNICDDDGGLPDTGDQFQPNTPLQIWNWSGNEYTNGDGTMTVCVSYYMLNVLTGEFV